MADKEERIFIFTQQKACDICKKNLEEYDGLTPDCGNCSGKEFPSMTHSEAIEKMAKGVCLELRKDFCSCRCVGDKSCNSWKRYKTFATAALNALLGVEK